MIPYISCEVSIIGDIIAKEDVIVDGEVETTGSAINIANPALKEDATAARIS